MRRSSRLTRFVWRLTALMQLFLPSTVSIADAQLERDSMSERASSHVESSTGKDCARAHQSDCALCQHIATPLTKAEKPAPPLPAGRADRPSAAALPTYVPGAERCPTLPRAPPST